MKAQISRESHRPQRRYSGVYHIQGAMVTDADLDERSTITRERTDNLGDDTIKDGVPAVGGAVGIAADGTVSLRPGIIYAGGVRGLLQSLGAPPAAPLGIFTQQADLPMGPALPGNTSLIVYADIWERPVFPLEDPYLADPGLHGAITGFRTRTMTQLKAAPIAALADIEAGTGAFPRIGTGVLAVTPLNAEILADECDPCADVVSAEQMVANALWRLEIISIEGTPNNPSRVVLAWSDENAAEIAPATVSPESFERANKVYEFFSPITESRAGVFANTADARLPAFVADMATTPAPPKNHNGQDWPFVRRWDGVATINTTAGTVVGSLGGGFTVTAAGKTITLRVGAFEAVLDLANKAVVPGDYWLVELRRHAAEADRIRLVQPTPVGIQHHYCTLVAVTNGSIVALTDQRHRKLTFPTLADLPADHVGFDNNCAKLYGNAENVQEALDNLCSISAEDIAFDPSCALYGDAKNVQEALDALCRVDFSVEGAFRLLFDWGVVCGIVPRKAIQFGGKIAITPGAYLDRAGRLTRFEGADLDVSDLKLGETVHFKTDDELHAALTKGEVCLALAAEDGGKTSIHLVPKAIAYGPPDLSFGERVKACIDKKKIVQFDDLVAKLPTRQKAAATKIVLATSGGGAFRSTARLTRAEFTDASAFQETLFRAFEQAADPEDAVILKGRVEKAKNDNPTGNLSGAALEIRQMQQATAIFAAYAETDEERLRRCLCDNLFPPCPPDLGKAPFFVPIACLRGSLDRPTIFLQEVCPYCCRKQAMTWRSVQYFIGDMRERLAGRLSAICCGHDDREPTRPGKVIYDPTRYTAFDPVRFVEEFKLVNSFLDRPEKLPSDFTTKVEVNNLSTLDAQAALRGTGIEIAETIDINDAKAFETIETKLTGVTALDLLVTAEQVRPGDKVGLLVQDGIARGYVLLERGSGKLPFEPAKLGVKINDADLAAADKLVRDTAGARSELEVLSTRRETLVTEIDGLRTDIEALTRMRQETASSLTEVRAQLTELAKVREALSSAIATASNELKAADESRKAITEAVRNAQPVTVVLGNDRPDIIAKLAGEGITTLADMAKLTPAAIRRLDTAGILKESEATALKTRATDFLKRPLG